MAKVPTAVEGEWFHIPRKWRQICCHCGLTHDWEFKVSGRDLLARTKINGRSTANARRGKKNGKS